MDEQEGKVVVVVVVVGMGEGTVNKAGAVVRFKKSKSCQKHLELFL